MSLNDFNHELQSRLIDFLWRQWVELGARASFEVENRDGWIIDPEALWLLTGSVARYDARLFDLSLDWIIENAAFINLPRLKSLTRRYEFQSAPIVAAMAETAARHNKRLKWSFPDQRVSGPAQPLFPHQLGNTEAAGGIEDATFRAFGLRRGPYQPRGLARRFNYTMEESALLRLRSLIGVNARAEIYAYLCTHDNGHPSGIARETGYSQKNIQDTMVDMSASHILFSAQLVGRKKVYLINKNEWRTLLYNPDQPPRWKTWPPIFRALEMVNKTCADLATKPRSPLFLSGRLHELATQLSPLLKTDHGASIFRPYESFASEQYSDIFFQDLLNWLTKEFNAGGAS